MKVELKLSQCDLLTIALRTPINTFTCNDVIKRGLITLSHSHNCSFTLLILIPIWLDELTTCQVCETTIVTHGRD